MVEFDEDMKQTAGPEVVQLSLHGQRGGQEGGAMKGASRRK